MTVDEAAVERITNQFYELSLDSQFQLIWGLLWPDLSIVRCARCFKWSAEEVLNDGFTVCGSCNQHVCGECIEKKDGLFCKECFAEGASSDALF